jgi:EAL domain-containing protein (putative c-di-GMP-specific phosphodiesterase class I)
MYKAKKDGRNRYCFYSQEMTERAIERLTLESKLRQAIEDDVFKVYFQPQLDGRSNTIIGLEALVRWFDEGTLVSPEKFIPLAEDTGLIVQMDLLIMKKAIRQVGLWYKAGLKPGTLSLNLSPRQLQHPEFISNLEKTLEKHGCRPEWIELEITEGHIMSDPEAAIIFLGRLAEKNIRLAIDDFGTGYSSLSYLKKLPLSKLKIDRSFVRDLPDNEDDVTITTTIIALATSLNLEIIAEGVETNEQRQLLVELGCPHLQGFLYSPARPAEEIEEFLKVNPFLSDLRN